MPGLYRDEGVVLRAIKLGEADRIVTIFTQGHGKIRAVAKGIRKTTSKFGARLEPTTGSRCSVYKGRDLDIVTQAETLESNRILREEYALLTRAIPMLEAVDQVAQDREANPALYRMLTGALRALVDTRNPLVTPAFFWKLLSLEGFHPMLDACSRCGEAPDAESPDSGEHELVAFDLMEGGTVCRACRAAVAVRSRRAGSTSCAGCSAAASTVCSPRHRGRRRTRSSSSGSARSSITSSAGCAPPSCSDPTPNFQLASLPVV